MRGLCLEAKYDDNAESYTLVATLPGQSDEIILLNGEGDGVTAYQATGPAALLGTMRRLASKPISERPRTVIALFSTHYCGSQGAKAWIDQNAKLRDKVVAYVGVESVAAERWIQDARGNFRKGEGLQPSWSYVSGGKNGRLVQLMMEMVVKQQLQPHTLVEDSVVFSEATVFHREWNLPTISTLSTPAYNLSASVPVVEKIDIDASDRIQRGYAGVIDELMKIDPNTIRR